MEKKVIYYDKLFPIYNNNSILDKLKIDNESVSYISSPIYTEKINKIIAYHLKAPKIIITDCTAGCGGDTIAFLNKYHRVYSIEKNIIRFNYLYNNIKAYEYLNKSRLYCDSFINIINDIADHNVVYIDPPWGGSIYKKNKMLKLQINNKPLEFIIKEFINNAIKIPNLILLKLPNNYDIKYLYDELKDYGKIHLYNLNKMFIVVLNIKEELIKEYFIPNTEVQKFIESF